MKKDYYLGLDIGTNSIGWAVTDEEYNLCRFKGKDMWGIRLFESAETAESRRLKRTGRRRLKRRNQRIKLLQALFAEEICKIDPTFFMRLNESKLHYSTNPYENDKSVDTKHVLFAGEGYNDIQYYNDYPTIYHLRDELISNPEKHDIRLVYLALHHIIKYRGHFLIEGNLNNAKEFSPAFDLMMNTLNEYYDFQIEVKDRTKFEQILKSKELAKSSKQKQLEALFEINEEADDKQQIKKRKSAVKELSKLVAGNQGNLKNLFFDVEFEDEEESLIKIKLSDSKYEEEVIPELEERMPEEIFLLDTIKSMYDWSVLVEILDNEKHISSAKVNSFNKHHTNLTALKAIMKKYCPKEQYKEFFDSVEGENNYSNYIGSVITKGRKKSVKKCKSEEEFYKNLKKILEKIKGDITSEDAKIYENIVAEVELQTLLPRQRVKDNSVIPKQVNEEELIAILENAKESYPFLVEKDADGHSVVDKIISIFNYRIPYYVGPLSAKNTNGKPNSWMKRKKDGEILPWNFEDLVDLEKSNEEFIRRMTNKCTYLPWEDVLPKCSMIYQEYMVLNELNNLTIRGKAITVEQKQDIYENLFVQGTSEKVTGKHLLTYLKKDDAELELSDLGGFDQDFKSSLASYKTLKNKVFGERIEEDHIKEICEDIIKWATIYNDGEMLIKVVKAKYGEKIDSAQLKAIKGLHFTGWGQFSKKLLKEISGVNRETGEVGTIMQSLWNTNNNLMQLLSSQYTFTAEIEKLRDENFADITTISYENLVDDLFTSPANKRAIWQTILITEEIKKVMGGEPKKIFVEMARGEEKEKKRTVSRKQQLIELYKACDKDIREWALQDIESRDERDFSSIKLYLYYTQMGRCAYTNREIDLDELMSGNSKWDRDHIYPQSRIKDDSLDNLVLVYKPENVKKDNELLKPEIQKRMRSTWKMWLDKKLISKKKYDRLTRKDDFTTDELSGFIARQLVETRQSTKLVADLLERLYTNSKIVKVKAGLVSDFRKTPLNDLKCRRVNDFHHAKDAYLNIVVGNVYNTRFTDNYREWIKANKDENWSINKVFFFDVGNAWQAPEKEKGIDGKFHAEKNERGEICTGTIDKVRRIVKQNNVLYTEYTYCDKGQLFDETLQKKEKATSIPLKKGQVTDKYGGYTSPNTSYFAQIEFDGKKGERTRQIIGVPIYVANMLKNNPNAFVEYCGRVKGLKNVEVITPKIKKNALLVIDGFPMRIRGENEIVLQLKSNMQLILGERESETIRCVEKWLNSDKTNVVEKYDGINDTVLIELYNLLVEKLKTVYRKRPANQKENLEKYKEKYDAISVEKKAVVINEIVTMLRCDNQTTANLKDIGGGSSAGNIAINKNTIGKVEKTIINQSVTGLFENRDRL